ncbi:hypothetical protein BDR26DRAFT_47557 [Obelidium mucronatum]|nr:hypothetical protein BDR26DRAFT_47557 [Obelidium mucronatum]
MNSSPNYLRTGNFFYDIPPRSISQIFFSSLSRKSALNPLSCKPTLNRIPLRNSTRLAPVAPGPTWKPQPVKAKQSAIISRIRPTIHLTEKSDEYYTRLERRVKFLEALVAGHSSAMEASVAEVERLKEDNSQLFDSVVTLQAIAQRYQGVVLRQKDELAAAWKQVEVSASTLKVAESVAARALVQLAHAGLRASTSPYYDAEYEAEQFVKCANATADNFGIGSVELDVLLLPKLLELEFYPSCKNNGCFPLLAHVEYMCDEKLYGAVMDRCVVLAPLEEVPLDCEACPKAEEMVPGTHSKPGDSNAPSVL